MAGNAVLLKDVIRVNPRFQRSVHLEKDYQTREQDQDYHIALTAMDMLRRMAAGFESDATVRAWTLTGPYGVGKSAFEVFLTRVMCDSSEQGIDARQRLQCRVPALADVAFPPHPPVWPHWHLFSTVCTKRTRPVFVFVQSGAGRVCG